MAGQIKVNTDKVALAATNIARYNQNIKDNFSEPENAIKMLDGFWDGVASENAKNAFYSIKSAYLNDRYNVVDNFVTFLRQQVDEGYTQTETANKSLSDAFK